MSAPTLRVIGMAVWLLLCVAVAGILVAPGDWFGLVLVAALAPVGALVAWYIMEPDDPGGYSKRLTRWVHERPVNALLFFGVLVAFALHIWCGCP